MPSTPSRGCYPCRQRRCTGPLFDAGTKRLTPKLIIWLANWRYSRQPDVTIVGSFTDVPHTDSARRVVAASISSAKRRSEYVTVS